LIVVQVTVFTAVAAVVGHPSVDRVRYDYSSSEAVE